MRVWHMYNFRTDYIPRKISAVVLNNLNYWQPQIPRSIVYKATAAKFRICTCASLTSHAFYNCKSR